MRKFATISVTLLSLLFISSCNGITEPNQNNHHHLDETKTNETIGDQMDKEFILPDTVLQKGDQGEAVSQLQHVLEKIGYPIQLTSNFDKMTTWAVTDFQLQADASMITGLYDEETRKKLNNILRNKKTINPGEGLPQPENPEEYTEIIENPYDVLALINKDHALPSDYIPPDLVTPNVRFPFTEELPKKQLRKIAAQALEELFVAADEANLNLFAQSGYRSYERQDAIFASNVQKHGEKIANTFSARPGQSEHQSGLTMDVTSPDVDFQLITEFGETKEGKWLQEHACDFGFIIRYPEGKEEITKYEYEPWHLRFVGKKAAKEIKENNLTLEEYLSSE